MLGTHHSWAVTMRNIFKNMIDDGHDCYLNSINSYSMCPPEWKHLLNREIEDPDLDICYTAPKFFSTRFKKKSKLKAVVYNYETSILPNSWKNLHHHVDVILPSSEFSKKIFIDGGWPEEKLIVIPHGVNKEDFLSKEKYILNSKKPFKFLNISIPHYRKNIDLLVEAYYEAFLNNDNVCLVLKTSLEKPKNRNYYTFECDVMHMIKSLQAKYSKLGRLPQVEIITEKIPNMVHLYNACDVLVSATSSEGFGLPLLEALAANKVVIAPRATGQLDFLNEANSLLVDVKEIEATEKYQYWTVTKGAKTYLPVKEDLKQKMLDAYNKNYIDLFSNSILKTVDEFTWQNASRKIIKVLENNV
jgi:glycosyltransferase involved in cell wall biosynthesis